MINGLKNKSLPHRRCMMAVLALLLGLNGCIKYGFSGASIPEGVNTVFIPFFADQSGGNVSDLSDRLNQVLINRFINQSSLHLAGNRSGADAMMGGEIISYSNAPFSVTGNENADRNQVKIRVHASFQFESKDKPEWDKTFSGASTYDPNTDPIEGENDAAQEALDQIANNMFNDAVSGW